MHDWWYHLNGCWTPLAPWAVLCPALCANIVLPTCLLAVVSARTKPAAHIVGNAQASWHVTTQGMSHSAFSLLDVYQKKFLWPGTNFTAFDLVFSVSPTLLNCMSEPHYVTPASQCFCLKPFRIELHVEMSCSLRTQYSQCLKYLALDMLCQCCRGPEDLEGAGDKWRNETWRRISRVDCANQWSLLLLCSAVLQLR